MSVLRVGNCVCRLQSEKTVVAFAFLARHLELDGDPHTYTYMLAAARARTNQVQNGLHCCQQFSKY